MNIKFGQVRTMKNNWFNMQQALRNFPKCNQITWKLLKKIKIKENEETKVNGKNLGDMCELLYEEC